MFGLEDKTVIITGCGNSKGIGFAIAKAYAAEKANLVLVDICPLETIGALAQPLLDAGAKRVLPYRCDVSDQQQVQAMVAAAHQEFGAIHILINNAGVMRVSKFLETKAEDLDLMYKVMVKGSFFCTIEAAKTMIADGIPGKIVNMSSIGGKRPWIYSAGYCACKSAIVNLTQTAGAALAPHGINVNGIAPGDHRTDMLDLCYEQGAAIEGISVEEFHRQAVKAIPLGHIGTVEDISNMCLYLTSPLADFIVGQVINVNGGSYMQ